MYLLQAARDADGGRRRRRRRSPSSCLLCAESPEMLEMKLALSISSGLIAYLPGWASASKASSLSVSLSLSFSLSRLHSRWTYEILTNGFIWPARHWTLDEQSTPPGIWRGGCGAGQHHLERCKNICWVNSTLRVCVCARCVHILFMFTYRNQFEVKPFEQDMKNPFMLFSQLQNQFLNFSLLQCSMPGHIYLP